MALTITSFLLLWNRASTAMSNGTHHAADSATGHLRVDPPPRVDPWCATAHAAAAFANRSLPYRDDDATWPKLLAMSQSGIAHHVAMASSPNGWRNRAHLASALHSNA
jgi:hypothetical protein